jgi:L-ascorbate metabolism protein UlaG (beta-lactamase superfamily)
MHVKLTHIGGPTCLIELNGFRLITDPTFDEPGEYVSPRVTLRKVKGPALSLPEVGRIDAVLLSHDQHADNLDRAGREMLRTAERVFTTTAGAARLGNDTVGLEPWHTATISGDDGRLLEITATPARHGPVGIEPIAGDVTGFVLANTDHGMRPIYITGDTVWYEGVAEVAKRWDAGLVVLFAGAAQTRGPFDLTMNCNDAVETAHAFPNAVILPIHCDGWAHFTEDAEDLRKTFVALGLAERLQVIATGANYKMEL